MADEAKKMQEQKEETKAMRTGGMVRGQGKALRGTRFKGVF